jgi:hypothetical protein
MTTVAGTPVESDDVYRPADPDPALTAPLRQALDGDQVQITTAGQLAELLGRLPADTPIQLAYGPRIDPGLLGRDDDPAVYSVAIAYPVALLREPRPG